MGFCCSQSRRRSPTLCTLPCLRGILPEPNRSGVLQVLGGLTRRAPHLTPGLCGCCIASPTYPTSDRATVRVMVCMQLAHSKGRLSSLFDAGLIMVSIIRLKHSGQRGRSIGSATVQDGHEVGASDVHPFLVGRERSTLSVTDGSRKPSGDRDNLACPGAVIVVNIDHLAEKLMKSNQSAYRNDPLAPTCIRM